MGSGVGSGWDPGGIRGPKVGSGGFQRGGFSKKRVGSDPPSFKFYNIKKAEHIFGSPRFPSLGMFLHFVCRILPALWSDFCENPTERKTRSCLSQTGAGFLFRLDPPSWPVPPLPAPPASRPRPPPLLFRLPDRIQELINTKGDRLTH